MSDHEERLKLIEDNYNDAADNEAYDLSQAGSRVEVATIQANLAEARRVYFSAAAEALTAPGQGVEEAYAAADRAVGAVRKARRDAEAIAAIIKKAVQATDGARKLAELAAKKL